MNDLPSADGLRVERRGSAIWVTLDRAEARNAMTGPMMEALRDAVVIADRDASVSVVAIRGTGEAFCAGADLVSLNAPDADPAGDGPGSASPFARLRHGMRTGSSETVRTIWTSDVPVVAGVNGSAAGMGTYLALASDVVVMHRDATLREVFLQRGLAPDTGAAWLLPRLVGLPRARRLLFFGGALSAAEAEQMGLVAFTADAADFDDTLEQVVEHLASGPSFAQKMTKRLLNRGAMEAFGHSLDYESLAQELVIRHSDFEEGIAAWLERRPPRFGHE